MTDVLFKPSAHTVVPWIYAHRWLVDALALDPVTGGVNLPAQCAKFLPCSAAAMPPTVAEVANAMPVVGRRGVERLAAYNTATTGAAKWRVGICRMI